VLSLKRASRATRKRLRLTCLHEAADGLFPDGSVVDERQVVLSQNVGQLRDPAASLR